MPRYKDMDWDGLEVSREQFNALTSVDRDVWQAEVLSHEELFLKMFDKLPKELLRMRELIISSLWRSPEHWEQIGDVHPEGWNE
jgi:phosphoenolpyruvate carboxykinase (GTP)